jgi:glycosyltransferase involved in cell wall biosynthesis
VHPFSIQEKLVIEGKRIAVVLPAYNAERTLKKTVMELSDLVDDRILVDDYSSDATVLIARSLDLEVLLHDANHGYGRNQKTCYAAALDRGADIVVMVHPDYQYTPRLVVPMASMVASDVYDVVLGSRILVGGALRGSMPLYKYISNRSLTTFQNLLLGAHLSEYHTGFRAYSKEVLRALPFQRFSDNFLFDNQLLAECIVLGARIGEISCPTRYFPEASSIGFLRSCEYGFGVLKTTFSCAIRRLQNRREIGVKADPVPTATEESHRGSA